MPPKVSNKAKEKEKKKVIEDKTFGLKNKNKSAKVQKFVQSVTKNVQTGSQADIKRMQAMDDKKKAKEDKRAFEEEMAKMFKTVDEKGDEKDEKDENFGCDPDDYLWRAEDFEEIEHDDRRLEEQLEDERELLKQRTDLTPVTEETFQAWKAKKRLEKEEDEKKRLKKAKDAGTGLRGKDLWEHDKSLFVDDEDADEMYEREESEEEMEDEDTGGSPKKHADPNTM